MPENIGLQPWQVPIGGDPPAVKTDLKRLALNAARQVNMKFADAAERDSVIVAGGLFPPVKGMVAWLDNPGVWTEYTGQAWAGRGAQLVTRRTTVDGAAAGEWGAAAAIAGVPCPDGRFTLRGRAVIATTDPAFDPQIAYLRLIVNSQSLTTDIGFVLRGNDVLNLDDDFYLPAPTSTSVAIQALGASGPVQFRPGSKLTITRAGTGPFGF